MLAAVLKEFNQLVLEEVPTPRLVSCRLRAAVNILNWPRASRGMASVTSRRQAG
jgi:hypothetical protein